MRSSVPFVQLNDQSSISSPEAVIRKYERENNLPSSVINRSADGKFSITITFPVLYKTKAPHSNCMSDSDNSFSESDYQKKIASATSLPENDISIEKKKDATLVRQHTDLAVQSIGLTLRFDANHDANTMLEKLELAAVTPYTDDLPYHARFARSKLAERLLGAKKNWGDKYAAVAEVDINEPFFPSPVANTFNAVIFPIGVIASCGACCAGAGCCCKGGNYSMQEDGLNEAKKADERFILTASYSSFFCQTRAKLSGPGVLTEAERTSVFESGRGQGGFYGRRDIPAPVRERMKL